MVVDEKLNTKQQHALAAQKPTMSWTASAVWAAGGGKGFCPSTLVETPPGVVCPALEPPAKEEHGTVKGRSRVGS